MSKLLDRLDRITRGPVRSLGFTPTSAREAVATMALVVQVADLKQAGATEALQAGADAIVALASGPALSLLEVKERPALPEGSTWGVEIQALDGTQAEALKGLGCDFLVFGIEHTPVEALGEGECTRVLRVSPALEDTLLRNIEDLPVDVVIVSKPGPEGPLSLAHLLAIANVRAATSRYLLVEWDAPLSARELEHLRDMGVDGIVVNASGEALAATVSALRERIGALPARKPRSEREGRAPLLPRLEGMGSGRSRAPEPDEEEEEEDY
ncbi:MAG: hypothetical protein HY533_05325 [Chloroflexi bacterium]|nr:hypothetical protein [Chloroflexota bacterium]